MPRDSLAWVPGRLPHLHLLPNERFFSELFHLAAPTTEEEIS